MSVRGSLSRCCEIHASLRTGGGAGAARVCGVFEGSGWDWGSRRAPDSRWGLGSVVTKEMSLENFLLILSIRADDGPRM